MKCKIWITGLFLVLLTPWVDAQSKKGNDDAPCIVATYGVYTYVNFELKDSVYTSKGRCDGMLFQSVEGLYEQYYRDDKMYTIYPESQMVTVVNTTPGQTKAKTIKIKRKNRLPESVLNEWANLQDSDTIRDYSSEVNGNYRTIHYKTGAKSIGIRFNLKTQQVEELVETRKVRNTKGSVDVQRVVTKLVSRETKTALVLNQFDLSQIVDVESNELTKAMVDKGYSLFKL